MLEDRTLPTTCILGVPVLWQGEVACAKENAWHARFDGVTGPREQQVQAVQQLLTVAGLPGAVSEYLGLDGMVEIIAATPTATELLRSGLPLVPGFRYMEPNFVIVMTATPNDTRYGELWQGERITGSPVSG